MGRIKLARWEKNEGEHFFRQSNDPVLYQNMSDNFPNDLANCKKMVDFFAESNDQQEYVRSIQIDQQIAGCIGAFFDSDIYRNNAEIAYWLGKDYRNRGIMSKVILDFTDELFLKTTVHRIYARPFAYNQASSKVLENTGFYCEGKMRESIFKDGKYFDSFLYSKIR